MFWDEKSFKKKAKKKGRGNYTYLFKEWLQTVELEYIAVPLYSPVKSTARQVVFHM